MTNEICLKGFWPPHAIIIDYPTIFFNFIFDRERRLRSVDLFHSDEVKEDDQSPG